MSSPTISHYVAVEHILCYLKEAFGRRILYKKHGHTIIEYFFDADWAGSKEDEIHLRILCLFGRKYDLMEK